MGRRGRFLRSRGKPDGWEMPAGHPGKVEFGGGGFRRTMAVDRAALERLIDVDRCVRT